LECIFFSLNPCRLSVSLVVGVAALFALGAAVAQALFLLAVPSSVSPRGHGRRSQAHPSPHSACIARLAAIDREDYDSYGDHDLP
jgi:hypothetical protein